MPTIPTPLAAFTLTVLGDVVGKERARHTLARRRNGSTFPRLYTPAKTVAAERRVADAWRALGSPLMPPGQPVTVTILATLKRPDGHYRKGGELSAAGLRSAHPTKRPDVDNIAKTVLDALNAKAWTDDAAVIELQCKKSWGACNSITISVQSGL